MWLIAIPCLAIAAVMVVAVVVDEVRSWFRRDEPELMRVVWREPDGEYSERTPI